MYRVVCDSYNIIKICFTHDTGRLIFTELVERPVAVVSILGNSLESMGSFPLKLIPFGLWCMENSPFPKTIQSSNKM